MDLSDSQYLIEIPDLSGAPKIKQLILRHCTRLYKIHTSLGDLKQLIRLDLNGCKCLEILPHKISLEALEIFDLVGCSRLKKFPKIVGNIEGLKELDLSGTAITGLPLSVVHLKNLKLLSLRGCVGLSSKSFNKLLSFPLMQRKRSPDPMSMLVCSLQGLWSLTELDLSYCNIQMIPDVLGSLSSLKKLDLEGNNFVCLPESIIQLSNLAYLYLSGCSQLQMLPKLPLNMKFIEATGCTSLETLSLSPGNGYSRNIRLVNCVKLIYNQGKGDLWSAILRHNIIEVYLYLPLSFSLLHVSEVLNIMICLFQRCCNQKWYTCFTIPGSEIPNWFRHQNVGASVNLQVPSHLSLSDKLMGIAVCAVYIFRQHRPLHQLYIKHYEGMTYTHELWCSVEANGGRNRPVWLPLSEEFGKIESYHLWLECFPFTKHFRSHCKEELDANELTQIKLTFHAYGPGLEVTKCGARLIFEQDIEDLNQTRPGSSSCTITPYYEDDNLGDSKKDSKIKESRDDEPPHPKWTEHPNLIENWIGNSCIQGQADSDCV